MPTYKTPGVYVEEISKFPPSVAAVETAIPAFIGYTQKAEKRGVDRNMEPIRIETFLEYINYFGDPPKEKNLEVNLLRDKDSGLVLEATAGMKADSTPSKYLMYQSLRSFYAQGGGPCYIVSVGTYTDEQTIDSEKLQKGLEAIEKEDEPTLLLMPEAQSLPEAKHFTLVENCLKQCGKLQDRFTIADLNAEKVEIAEKVSAFRNKVSVDLKYGAAYTPDLVTTFNYAYDEKEVAVVVKERNEATGEVSDAGVPDNLEALKKDNSALYNRAKEALSEEYVTIPPSGAVAGVYARVDASRGVWKAPANEALSAVSELTVKINNNLQDRLNVDPTSGKSVNAIRAFAGRGTLIWGGRTLDGNSNEWRYISVRRFFNMVEESTKKATAQFVFEPNDKNTWVKVRAMIENFLLLQWRAGALQGAKPEQAFYVKVGLGQTMSPLDILEGRMIVEIGMAVVRPAEFIILRFSHKMPEA